MRQNGVYDTPCLRLTVEGILYRMRVGCPWRDLPKYFGKWNSVERVGGLKTSPPTPPTWHTEPYHGGW